MTCGATAAALIVDNLSWGVPKKQPIISAISFAVECGQRIAIIGPNGAGKSTLLRCLYRANRPDSGTVKLDGRDIWSIKARDVALKVAAVLQETPSDFPFTVMDIVLMGRIPHRSGITSWGERDRVQAHHSLQHMELARFAGRSFATLSGGEKQRVLVARALAQEPGIIILDEPTNHLDIRHQMEILQILKALGITVVTTLHDINLASGFADKIALVSQGRLVDYGSPNAVLTNASLSQAFNITANRYLATTEKSPRFFFNLPSKTTKMETSK